MMAEAQEDDEIFVYMGGDQVVPDLVRRAEIHKSVKIVRARAFYNRQLLIFVEFHDGVEIIEEEAFNYCYSLRGPMKLLGVKIIKAGAFSNCDGLTDIEFGDKLETIETWAFSYCRSLRKITMPSVRTIGKCAFRECIQLTDLELPEGLETMQDAAFGYCSRLRRIAMPLKDGMIGDRVFIGCHKLTTVDLVGRIHKTVVSLHLESWNNEMKDEINRIKQTLPTIEFSKNATIRSWMGLVTRQLNHYKAEHQKILKEATTLLELAIWKANLDDYERGLLESEGARTTRGQRERARREIWVTSGASIVIKNVLPFLCFID